MMCAILSGERLCDASKGVISSVRVCVPGTRSVYGMPSMGQKIKTYQLKSPSGRKVYRTHKTPQTKPQRGERCILLFEWQLGLKNKII